MASNKTRQVTLAEKIRYGFDRSMAAGPIALIGWLAVISLIAVSFAALVLTIAGIKPEGGEAMGFGEAAWASLMRTLDSGTMGGDAGWGFRWIMLFVTICGIFIVSILIGVVTSGLEGKLDELRKGRSFVIEEGHTLILGWSSNIFTIISELLIANANQKKARIVIMADKDKVEMEEEIRSKVGSTGKTRVICRTGSPIDLYDLEIVNPHQSKSIIILSPEAAEPDSQVIKTILAITNNPRRREEPYHIVAEIRDSRNMEAAHLVGRDETKLVQANELIARITVQTCRQSGMSVVYTELLDYEGDEIYFQEEPALAGKTFGDSLTAYENCAVMGLHLADGGVRLNPPMDTRIGTGDRIIAIAEDDDKLVVSGLSDMGIDAALIRQAEARVPQPERTIILGWNQRGNSIIEELGNYVPVGSQLMVVADFSESEISILQSQTISPNLSVSFKAADTTDRRTLESLEISDYQHVIVLGYTDRMEVQAADSRTLITLLHLRGIEEKSGKPLSIVSEMLDIRNRELAEVTQADDFIVSDKLISLLMTQVSENKHLHAVFADLFDSDGSEIYLKQASDYVAVGETVNFYTIVEAARQRSEVAIGYRQAAFSNDSSKQYGVKVNPKKSEKLAFTGQDCIIVIADS